MSSDLYDMEERIASLKVDLKTYSKEIMDNIQSLYSDPAGKSFDLKSNSTQILKILHHDVIEILQVSKEKKEVDAAHATEIKECSELVGVLMQISSLSESLINCERQIDNLMLLQACKTLSSIQDALTALPDMSTDVGSGAVCSLLRKEHRIHRSRLVSKLQRLLKEAVQFERGRVVVYGELNDVIRCEDMITEDPIALADIWEAVLYVCKAEAFVGDLLSNCWLHIMKPLWREKRSQAPHVSSNGHKSELIFENMYREPEKAATDFSRSASSEGMAMNVFTGFGSCRMPLPALFDHMGQIVSFLWSEVFCGNTKLMNVVLAKLNAPPISFLTMLTDAVSLQMPKTEAELVIFRRSLEKPCQELDEKLHLFGFEGSSGSSGAKTHGTEQQAVGPLQRFWENMPVLYSDMRRRELLEGARDVVLSDYHNTMTGTGDAAEDELSTAGDIGNSGALLEQSVSFALQSLKFDSCQISLTSCRLLKYVHEVLKLACSASAALANVYFHVARDCLDMFMTIVPVRFADAIYDSPRMGAVFFNDCLYIAHNVTLITHKYRHELGKIDEQFTHTVGFADFIPRLRTLGDQCLMGHAEHHRNLIANMVVARMKITPSGVSREQEGVVGVGGFIGAIGAAVPKVNVEVRPGGLFSAGQQLAGYFMGGGGSSEAAAAAAELRHNTHTTTDLGGGLSTGSENRPTVDINNEDGAEMVERHLFMLSQQWQSVLQETAYIRLIGFLLESTIALLMAPLMQNCDCISENAGSDIARIYRVVQKSACLTIGAASDVDLTSSSASSLSSSLPSSAASSADDISSLLNRICPSWRKFLALTDLLEYSLSEIAEQLPRRKFASFTGSELSALIRALFDDSPRRQSVLDAIIQMSS